jgi:antitoxin component YwqK of YwqJK toxin-antitoxin module
MPESSVADNNFSGEYREETDSERVVICYKNGKKDGKTSVFSRNGTILFDLFFRDDVLHGPMRQFYSSGQILSITNFVKGKQTGPFLIFFENGMKQTEANYTDGKLNGFFVSFDEFGDKASEIEYSNGARNGKTILYYPKSRGGGILEVSVYEDGLLEGNKVCFHETGEIES